MTSSSLFNATVAELDSDGSKIEVVAVTGAPTPGAVGVWVWQPKAPTLPVPWGHFHQDEKRNGRVPGTPSCPTPAGARFTPLTPCRVIDTRWATVPTYGGPALAANETRSWSLAGQCSIPASARAIAVNATVTGAGATGSIALSPGDLTAIPVATTLSFRAGKARACSSVIRLSSDSQGRIRATNLSSASTHFLLDVSGYFD